MRDNENRTVRSFVTKCKNCMNSVLYWESSRGSKVFFNYPVGEKLQRHICKPPEKGIKTWSFAEQQFEIHHREQMQCPVCGKIFADLTVLNQHVSDSKKSDLDHFEFSQYFFEPSRFAENSSNLKEETKIQHNFSGKGFFGRITIRKAKIKQNEKKT